MNKPTKTLSYLNENGEEKILTLQPKRMTIEVLEQLATIETTFYSPKLHAARIVNLSGLTDAEVIEAIGEEKFKVLGNQIRLIRNGASFEDLVQLLNAEMKSLLDANEGRRRNFLRLIADTAKFSEDEKAMFDDDDALFWKTLDRVEFREVVEFFRDLARD